jgi:glutamate racemase
VTVGVFDSGVGGLTILREVRAALPRHDLVYVADTRYCPYGPRTDEEVRARSDALTRALRAEGAEMVIVACNTATIAAIAALRASHEIPFVGVEPAVKPAARETRTGVVGVLATESALAGARFRELVEAHAAEAGVAVVEAPCPGLVTRIEAGELNGRPTREVVRGAWEPLAAGGADTLVLACTHFPHVRALIEEVVGPGVGVIDSGPAVARQARRIADAHGIAEGTGGIRLLSTDTAAALPGFRAILGDVAVAQLDV